MKKNSPPRPVVLKLQPETIRPITTATLVAVAGGAATGTSCHQFTSCY